MTTMFRTPCYSGPLYRTPLFGAAGAGQGSGGLTYAMLAAIEREQKKRRRQTIVVDEPDELLVLLQQMNEASEDY